METASGTYDSENRSVEEMTRYLNGLKRYTEKGIPIYMDGKLSGQREWEKLFEVREDGMFYMGDYVQAEVRRQFTAPSERLSVRWWGT